MNESSSILTILFSAPLFHVRVLEMTSCNDNKKYWESMDDLSSSWAASLFGAVITGISANKTGNEQDEEKPEAPPSTKKPDLIKRASTVSTILDSELSSSDLYHDGQQGWEVTLPDKRTWLEKYTRHPHFGRRLSMCSMFFILLIALIAVLSASLSGESVTSTANSVAAGAPGAGNDINTGGSAEATRAPKKGDGSQDVSESPSSFDLSKPASPFSTLDPVADLGMFSVVHSRIPPASLSRISANKAMPTNAWYENLIVGAGEEPPTDIHKAYAVPYLVDTVGPIAGIRIHPTHLDAQDTLVQLLVVEPHGLTLGASGSTEMAYSIASTNPLGVTLEWVRSCL